MTIVSILVNCDCVKQVFSLYHIVFLSVPVLAPCLKPHWQPQQEVSVSLPDTSEARLTSLKNSMIDQLLHSKEDRSFNVGSEVLLAMKIVNFQSWRDTKNSVGEQLSTSSVFTGLLMLLSCYLLRKMQQNIKRTTK